MMGMEITREELQESYIFSLDIGTRSIIGIVGCVVENKFSVLAIEKEEHHVRSMIDGQIEDISQVAMVARHVKEALEKETGIELSQVYVAAAGRALKTNKITYSMELESQSLITEEIIRNLENGALMKAEESFLQEKEAEPERLFYMIGYTVSQYYLDSYPISSLLSHKGKELRADVITTFLPSEVVESLYSTLRSAGIEVAGMTLEPIASMNAAIPRELRLLNLALVDIGAGTSDIAVARDGGICGYTMATVAGDEVTEHIMQQYLVDFQTAEYIKMQLNKDIEVAYTDVLGMGYTVKTSEVSHELKPIIQELSEKISRQILAVNEGVPSAVFLAGGGSKLAGIREEIARALDIDVNRIALGGNNYNRQAFSEKYDLNDPEYSTPLGIGISAGLNLINDSFYVKLNGQRAKLFHSGRLSVRDILMMNGYGYKHLIGRSGQSLKIEVDGQSHMIRGQYSLPAQILINGHEALVSDIVNAGDEIIFTPAVSGKDASSTVMELPGFCEKGCVFLDEQRIPIGVLAEIEDTLVSADTLLKPGDKVHLVPILTVKDLIQYKNLNQMLLVNGQPYFPDQMLEADDVIESVVDKKKTVPSNLNLNFEKSSDISSSDSVLFCLNGKDISLFPKAGEEPFYLMDLLDSTGMDFSKPQGIICLEVNGQEAGFQTELKTGDRVEIYWSKNQ